MPFLAQVATGLTDIRLVACNLLQLKPMTDNNLQLQILLDHMDSAVLWLDEELAFLYANPAAEMMLEKSEQKLRELSAEELFLNDSELCDLLRDVQSSGRKLTRREFTVEVPHHRAFQVNLTLTPLFHHGMLVEMRTLERLNLIKGESTLQHEHLATRSLMRGLAHEIKNPLGGIRGAAQLLQADLGDDPNVHEYTEVMIKETDRLKVLIDRMSGPATRPKMEPTNIHSVADHVHKLLEAESAPNVSIQCDYDPSLPDVMADEDQLIQATLNIARNALESLPEDGGSITFQTRIRRQYTLAEKFCPLVIALSIIDDGPGVPKSLQSQIFFPMVTGKPTGTGLGLPTAQSLIDAQGGSIKFTSEPGETVFEILLPVAEMS